MDGKEIRAKFGDDYVANERTFTMGMDRRITARLAQRFQDRVVLETCTGAGFTTIALARTAARVITVEIDPVHQAQAKKNVTRAGLAGRVTFLRGDILDEELLGGLSAVDAAFLDPDWADREPDHVYRFIRSNTRPPADELLERIFDITGNIALILPPSLDTGELSGLPVHERQSITLEGEHVLYCLYFGELILVQGDTELRLGG
ncbi:MAG: methyltransferase domain-containing protein [Candidatus Krumholzibacteriota bacterium]|nr:methyltransferase domain-containing protein [Candidatus Krumholzibacteriota bacterium]